ncbi:MAG: hypothetical protein L0H96_22640 [Humibacillus sp.]|nr:hypothetical protein [Humibacillus sp.]MDN5779692.1 hypothetical protein [Humibacillus sp.]
MGDQLGFGVEDLLAGVDHVEREPGWGSLVRGFDAAQGGLDVAQVGGDRVVGLVREQGRGTRGPGVGRQQRGIGGRGRALVSARAVSTLW